MKNTPLYISTFHQYFSYSVLTDGQVETISLASRRQKESDVTQTETQISFLLPGFDVGK